MIDQIPTCGSCGKPMRFNVPRLGPDGGYVHDDTGSLDCGPYVLPQITFPPLGPVWHHGPNDQGYINREVRDAARRIQDAIFLYCEGRYPYRNALRLPLRHPLAIALRELATVDKETCAFANAVHDELLFTPYEPSEEALCRSDLKP